MNNIDSMFSQEREYERFKREWYKAGVKDSADKIYRKLINRGMTEEEAREIVYGDEE